MAPTTRRTYATWLEDAGISGRVIDELMGDQASSRGGHLRGSAIGAHYRHTTQEMGRPGRRGYPATTDGRT
jgi:hypothetical protein